MDLKIPKLDDLKDRLDFKDRFGFKDASHARPSSSHDDRHDDHYDDPYDDSYDDFGQEDFGEYAFDDNADYARETREPREQSEPRKDAAATVSFAPQMPKLVTADDVRAHTQYTPNEEAIDAAAGRVERPVQADEPRPAPFDTTFEPAPPSQGAHAAKTPVSVSSAQTGAFAAVQDIPAMPAMSVADPQTEVAAPAPAQPQPRIVQRATRILTVIKPESYADAERIAKILKAGDVAVLSLRSTPDALGKRILDFSFGVACALDARVECVSGHVFALTRGAGLTEGETNRLRDQGLM